MKSHQNYFLIQFIVKQIKMDKISHLVEYLRGRPIARVFEQCHEKDNIIALKFLCILDHELERLDLYAQINQTHPKLLTLLLQFNSFAGFRYYDHMVKRDIGARVLRCKFCDLVGSYAYILNHMSINHNTHIGMILCAYCNRTELEKHFNDSSLEQCYRKYIQQNEWHGFEWGINISNIVSIFFKMLKALARMFGVYSPRTKFIGRGYGTVETLNQSYGDDLSSKCIVYHRHDRKSVKDLSKSTEFEAKFRLIMGQKTDRVTVIDQQNTDIPMEQIRSLVSEENHARVSLLSYMSLVYKFSFRITNEISICLIQFGSQSMIHIPNTSWAHDTTRSISPVSLLLCSTSTSQDDSKENVQSTISISSTSSAHGLVSPTGNQSNHLSSVNSFEANISSSNATDAYNHLPFDTVQFGLFVAQRLAKMPDQRTRRKLEHSIQSAILDVEKETFF